MPWETKQHTWKQKTFRACVTFFKLIASKHEVACENIAHALTATHAEHVQK